MKFRWFMNDFLKTHLLIFLRTSIYLRPIVGKVLLRTQISYRLVLGR